MRPLVKRGLGPAENAVLALSLAVVALLSLPGLAVCADAVLRFPGEATTLAINRTNGKLAVCQSGKLLVFDSVRAPAPTLTLDLPGREQVVREFRGNTLVYVAHAVAPDKPRIFVAMLADGRERVAWPNEGISEHFPNEESHLTLDGRGIYGRLVLDGAIQESLGLPDSVPLGAGVVATYRFAGEKLAARGSDVFRDVVALTPDDFAITMKDGGILRYKAAGGIAWKLDKSDGSVWRLADVDIGAGLILVIVDGRSVIGVDLDKGEARWSWDAANAATTLRRWLGSASEEDPTGPIPQSPPARKSKRGPTPTPTPAPTPAIRVLGVRNLVDGRVLVLLGSEPQCLAVLDPRSGQIGPSELLGSFERGGAAGLSSFWAKAGANLSGLDEARIEGRSTLLVHAPAGWYEVALP